MLCKEKMFAQNIILDLYSRLFVTTRSGFPESQNPLSILVVYPVRINAEETSGHVRGHRSHVCYRIEESLLDRQRKDVTICKSS